MKRILSNAIMAIKTIYHCLIILGDAIAVFHAVGFLASLHLVGIF